MSQAVIEYAGVIKRFESQGKTIMALDNIDLTVGENEFTSVIGPSGCGKTTLMRLCAGLEDTTEGSTLYRGSPVEDINTDVGYVTQDSNLYPWMTLRGNVEFPLEIHGMPREERRERADRWIRMVGLEGFEDHWPYQLSGGMQKRGSIIRTMVYEPSVVLMDEPFGPLDAQTRMVLQADLLRIWSEQQQTILFITHDITEAIALSDTVVVMSARPGRVKATFKVPMTRPRDVFQIHEQPGFAEIYGQIWETFRSEVVRDPEPGDAPPPAPPGEADRMPSVVGS
ncbi:MAG: ABC transporter ATP-binding protein [Candidatus Limnocylindria bacterium]